MAVAPACPPLVVVNEHAGGRAMADVFRRVERRLREALGSFEVAFTDGPGHATTLAAEALDAGCGCVVAAGGLGTVHEVINGWFKADGTPRNEAAVLALLPVDEGHDLARALGIRDPDEALAALAKGRTRRIDLGLVRCEGPDGEVIDRRFANGASVGLSVAMLRHVPTLRGLTGRASYALSGLWGLAGWENLPLSVTIDDGPPDDVEGTLLAVGNSCYAGGGMRLVPDARVDDGRLHIMRMEGLTRWEMLGVARLLYDGGHVYEPSVRTDVASRVRMAPRSARPVEVEVDGESVGRAPVEFSIIPQAIDVRVP
jgi:diacylglycerol kinase (ATP)